jgi:hypothetical protein
VSLPLKEFAFHNFLQQNRNPNGSALGAGYRSMVVPALQKAALLRIPSRPLLV